MIPSRVRILVAEDDDELRAALVDILDSAGFDVVEVGNANAVKEYADESFLLGVPHRRVHALVSDIRMPGMSGLCLLEYLRDLGWKVPTVLITAFGGPETQAMARELGPCAVLDKPFTAEEIQESVRAVLRSSGAGRL